MVIIRNRKELTAYLQTCKETEELRKIERENDPAGRDGEWSEFHKEIVDLCFDKEYLKDALALPSPPALGQDWNPWLKKHLEDVIEEAISIVM
jgi:hypothetical protein